MNGLLGLSALFIPSVMVIMCAEQIEGRMALVRAIYLPGSYSTVCRSLNRSVTKQQAMAVVMTMVLDTTSCG